MEIIDLQKVSLKAYRNASTEEFWAIGMSQTSIPDVNN